MPNDLADVLHYFFPDPSPTGAGREDASGAGRTPPLATAARVEPRNPPFAAPTRAAALPIVAVPIGESDVVRAAFTWNLAVEVARLGGSSALVAPDFDDGSPLWPEPGAGPVGSEVVLVPANGIGDLYRAALDVAVARAADSSEGGVVLVRVPPLWLRGHVEGCGLLRWSLLFTSSDPRALLETYGLAKLLRRAHPRGRIGVTVHGARHRAEAEQAFDRLAASAARRLEHRLESYGLLVDDLHVYRAIVAQRPIGLAHPQSPAARSLRDVAGTLLADARETTGSTLR